MRFTKKIIAIAIVFLTVVSMGILVGVEYKKDTVAEQKITAKSFVAPQTVLKKYYIKNARYTLPCKISEGRVLSSAVKVTANGLDVSVVDGTFTVPDCENLSFTFEGDVVENRPVIDVNFGSALAIDKYFLADGGTVTAEKKNLRLVNSVENATYKFIRELDANNFNCQFKILEDNGFEKVTLKLTDYSDDAKSTEIAIINLNGQAFLSINGGEGVTLSRSFADSTKNYNLSLESGNLTLEGISVTVENSVNSFAYLEISVDAYENSCVEISSLNSQPLNNLNMDVLIPKPFFVGSRDGEVDLGGNYTIYPVYAVDVLDPYTEITYSVRTPSGGSATAIDGTKLQNVSASETYEFCANEYGYYSCVYSCTDTSGNTDKFTCVVSVLDKVKPTITANKKIIRGTTFEALNVPEYKASDDNTAVEDIVVTIQIIDTEYRLSTIREGTKYIPTKAGVYTIKYMAIDKSGNICFAEVICVVSEGNVTSEKGVKSEGDNL